MPEPSIWTIDLEDETATLALARDVAGAVRAGDLVTLSGDLGAGKTAFARGLIRTLADDPALEVPSPTFTLMQIYETDRFPVVHADLYRLRGADELAELGWEEAAHDALVVVEWPERAGVDRAPDRLDISLHLDPQARETRRIAVLAGHGSWRKRLEIVRGIHLLLDGAGWRDARRTHLVGDASSRAYERLVRDGESTILMISPKRPDGPPVRAGKPYSHYAKLAETVRPFVAVADALREAGFSAPRILAHDMATGLLLLEDFGTETVLTGGRPDEERYLESVQVLARIHSEPRPGILPLPDGSAHAIPPYDLEAYLIEAELLIDWYAPHIAHATLPAIARSEFVKAWTEALTPVAEASPTWTLRDYHSPNLMWLPEREAEARVGLLDFQDALMGHPAYDVVSLAQDARVDVAEDLELRLVGAYVRARRQANPAFDVVPFTNAYALLGAQRATKILGIFARLDRRDHKPHYLRHIPRIERALRRNLGHPAAAGVRAWYEAWLPRLAPSWAGDPPAGADDDET